MTIDKSGIATTKIRAAFIINGKGHDHRTKYDKRRTQKQSKHEIDTGLDLVDVTCHPRDQARRTKRIRSLYTKAIRIV